MKKITFLLPLFLYICLNCEAYVEYHPREVQPSLFERTPELDFSKILLIINYNHPYYESIPFLREIYSHVFPHIVFYGEQPNSEVQLLTTKKGYFCQKVIAHAMEKWPNFDGYICVQDDCVMNFWNFSRLDKNKIWMTSPGNWAWFDIYDNNPHSWPWVNLPIGRAAVQKYLRKLPQKNVENLEKSFGKGWMAGSVVDFVYIPGRLKDEYISLCKKLPPMFVEIALPFLFACIEDAHNWELLVTVWCPPDIFKDYSTGFDWIHPFKFSNHSTQNFIRNIMNTWKANQLANLNKER